MKISTETMNNGELWQANNYGHSRAPVELIAYVVENDKPYTEILTADYTMVTPLTADILNAQLEDPWEQTVVYDGEYTEFHKEFRPAKNLAHLTPPPSGDVCIPIQGANAIPAPGSLLSGHMRAFSTQWRFYSAIRQPKPTEIVRVLGGLINSF